MNETIARTPQPPYYLVVFTSTRTEVDKGYEAMAERMLELAADQEGFLGVESVRQGCVGITVSYWASEEAIARWKRHAEHREAQRLGRACWYERFAVRVAKVERDAFHDGRGRNGAGRGSPVGTE